MCILSLYSAFSLMVAYSKPCSAFTFLTLVLAVYVLSGHEELSGSFSWLHNIPQHSHTVPNLPFPLWMEVLFQAFAVVDGAAVNDPAHLSFSQVQVY